MGDLALRTLSDAKRIGETKFYGQVAITRLIYALVVQVCDGDCQRDSRLGLNLRTNHGVS